MTKIEGKQGKGTSEPIREDNRDYPRSYTGVHTREGRYGYDQDKHVQRMSSKFNRDLKKRRYQEKKKEEHATDTPHDCIRVEMCEFYARDNAREHNTDMYEIVYGDPSNPVYRRGQPFRMSVRFKDRQFDPDHDNVRLVFNFGPNPSVPKETKIYLPLTSSENRYDEEKISSWDARINRIDGNCMDVEVFIPADAPVGVWRCWVETCPEGFPYYRRDGSPYRPRSTSPFRRNRSPYRQSRSPRRRDDSRQRSGSPYRWDWAPYYRAESPYPRDRDSYRQQDDYRDRSYYDDDRYWTKEGRRRSRSPRRQSRSPRRQSRSPRRQSRSPRRQSRSPFRRDRSTSRFGRSRSRERRDGSRNQSLERRRDGQYRRDGSRDSRRRGSPFRRRDGSRTRRDSRDYSSYERDGSKRRRDRSLFRSDRGRDSSRERSQRSNKLSWKDSFRFSRSSSPVDRKNRDQDWQDRNSFNNYDRREERDSSPFRMNSRYRQRGQSPSRRDGQDNFRSYSLDSFPGRQGWRDDDAYRRRDRSPYGYERRRDGSPSRYGGWRDGSPSRFSDRQGRRDSSPSRYGGRRDFAYEPSDRFYGRQGRRDGSLDRFNDPQGRRYRSLDRLYDREGQRDGSPDRFYDRQGRRDGSPGRCYDRQGRRDGSRDRFYDREGRRDRSPGRFYDRQRRRDGSLDRLDDCEGRRDRSPDRFYDREGRRDGSPDRFYDRQGMRFGSPDRFYRREGQRDGSPERYFSRQGWRSSNSNRFYGREGPMGGSLDRFCDRRDGNSDRFFDRQNWRDESPERYDGPQDWRRGRGDNRYDFFQNRRGMRSPFRQCVGRPYWRDGDSFRDGSNDRFRRDSPYQRGSYFEASRSAPNLQRYEMQRWRNDGPGSSMERYRRQSSSPFRRDRGRLMRQGDRRWRSSSPYQQMGNSMYRDDQRWGPNFRYSDRYENDSYYGEFDGPFQRGNRPYSMGYGGPFNGRRGSFDDDHGGHRQFNRDGSLNRGNWAPFYNRGNSPFGNDSTPYGMGYYDQDSMRNPDFQSGRFNRNDDGNRGNRSRDQSPFRCGRTAFRRGGSPYRHHSYPRDRKPQSPFRRDGRYNDERRDAYRRPRSFDGSRMAGRFDGRRDDSWDRRRSGGFDNRRSASWDERGGRRDFRDRGYGDWNYRRDGDKYDRRDGDSSYRRDGSWNFRRDGDWSYRRDGDQDYRRDDDFNYRRDGDWSYRRDGDQSSRRDGDFNYRRDGDWSYRRDGDQNYRRDGDWSYRRDGDQYYRRDGDFNYRRDGVWSYRRDGDQNYRRDGDFDYRRDGDQYYRRDGDFDYRRDGDWSYRRDGDWRDRRGDDYYYRRDGDRSLERDGRWHDRKDRWFRDGSWDRRRDWSQGRRDQWDYRRDDDWRYEDGYYRGDEDYRRQKGPSYPYDYNGEVFKCKQDIYILFNPWCRDDPTFMDDELCRREYVLNDMGKIWVGTYRRNRGRRWVYGHFDDVVLPAVMYLMEEARLSGTDRANPIQMVRAITEMVNNRDYDGGHSSKKRKNSQNNCLMVGRWDGKYDDGVSPYAWTGSARILEQYMRTGKPVKYGQCWVFAAVTTTICRALGIPCRPVTNFVSAHDTNNSMSVDKYFSCSGDEIERGPDGDSWDSIWSFHSWNDVWMDRPDLPPGFGGWQAIDSTYQEECDGRYKCGPASLECIRQGEIGFNYDTRYIFSEVNAEINHWQEDENSDWGFTRMRPGRYHVGTKILTKAPEFDDDEYDEDCMNVIDEYKQREHLQEHSRVMQAFRGKEGGTKPKKSSRLYMDHEDVIFDLEEMPRVYIGQPFMVEMHIVNRSGETRSIEAMLSCHSMYYNGVKDKRVKQDKALFVVPPNQHETFILRITPEDYEDKMVDYCMMKLYAISNVKETGQVWGEEEDFCFEKPRLQIQTRGPHQVGEDMEANFSFTNPLKVTLTNCRFTFEGPGLQRSRTVKYRDVKPGESASHVERFVPKQPGETKIIATFTSHQLNDVYGSRTVAFRG